MSKKNKKCSCGKYEKCIRKIHSSKNGRMWVETVEHFQCGKIQEQIKKLNEIFK